LTTQAAVGINTSKWPFLSYVSGHTVHIVYSLPCSHTATATEVLPLDGTLIILIKQTTYPQLNVFI